MKFTKNIILLLVCISLLYSFASAHSSFSTPSPSTSLPKDTIVETTIENDTTDTQNIVIDTIFTKEKDVEEIDTTLIQSEKPPLSILNFTPSKGLDKRHIALWQSHGLYYMQSREKWKWQRVNLFETREDLYTQSYILPFLVPMLENAG
ncbi:MAG: putative exported xanthan lyase/N-acetylmuramoyl-L-alanine amidase [Bacteroidetes bacterium]|nr:putative exported xanthan lyase/N-acetylmuramoyl-L-alanine amidase [Bacteroidota bacterium]